MSGSLSSSQLAEFDAFWMPFTANRVFKRDPRMLVSADGMYYTSEDGRSILDGTAGLWCSAAGHCRSEITDAIRAQAGTLDFAPTFQLGHPKAFEFADRLAAIMPQGLDRIFFTNSGSESADTALKMALAYQKARGQAGRTRLIGRERGYHGTNFGGTSVGGLVTNRRAFGAHLWGVDHLPHTHQSSAAFTRGQPNAHDDMARALLGLIALHGAETIAAVIVEPVAGSAGVLIPPRGYLEQLRAITAQHGIVLIFDEVITGLGRLGGTTAAEVFGVTPDIITLAKALTNATVPMGAVATSRKIYDTIVNEAPPGIEFFHGYTCSGHPLAAAAGIAALDLYANEDLFARAAACAPLWQEAMHSLQGTRHVIDVRAIGLMAGIELQPRSDAPGARTRDVFHRCFDEGFLVRVTGDVIALSPPLIVSEDQIAEMVGRLSAAIHATD